jgi:hypothetical protein
MKEIGLTRGLKALVDDDDFEELSKVKWCANKIGRTFYAVRRVPNPKTIMKQILMHRKVMNAPIDICIDHIDGNGLNNTKDNLRFCTKRENVCGQKQQIGKTSKYKGVCWNKRENKWKAYIKCHQKLQNLGHFDTEISAALAYDNAANRLFGEFARTNL